MTSETTATTTPRPGAQRGTPDAKVVPQQPQRVPAGRRTRYRSQALALCIAALFVALLPLSLFAASPFGDLTGGVHDANIEAIYNAGITTGCVPNQQYCPLDGVTRQEMASFLARTAGLGGNPPVANAATVEGKRASELVRVAQNTRNTNSGTTVSGNTFTQFFTVQIAVPANGFVLIGGNVSAVSGAATSCTASMRLRDIGGGTNSPEAHATTPPTTFSYVTLNQSHIFPVFGSQTLTFAMDVAINAQPNAACALNFFDPTLTALYVPFGAAGTGALGGAASLPGE